MSQAKTYMSIGELLKALSDEFPDVSISKIRFLENAGLIEPERTPSGYRKFFAADLERLRYILKLQRDQFMPLKVIRKRLENFDPNVKDKVQQPSTNNSVVAASEDEEITSLDGGLSLSFEELVSSSGLTADELSELIEYGLIDAHELDDSSTFYDEDDLVVAKLAKDFGKYGIGARHLKMYKNFAEKETGLFEQIVVPLSRNSSDSRRTMDQSLFELAKLSKRLKQVLLRASLRGYLRG